MAPIIAALSLIIHVIFDAYIIVLILRLILQKLGASWHNPITQFLIKLTETPLKPLRRLVPGFKGFDLAIILLAVIVQLVEIYLLFLISANMFPNIFGVLMVSIAALLTKTLYIYIYAIIINAIASWVPAMHQSPAMHLIYLLVNPILSRVGKIIPPIAGIDLSPMFAILALLIINILLLSPLMVWAKTLL